MKLYLIGMIVLLAAILLPLTALAHSSRPPKSGHLIVLPDGSIGPSYQMTMDGGYQDNSSGSYDLDRDYSNANYGNYNQEQRVDVEGFSIGAAVKVGGSVIALGYNKAKAKASQKAKIDKKSPSETDVTCETSNVDVKSTQVWLVDVKSNQPICSIVIDRIEKIRQFKSEIAVDRMIDKKKKEIVRYKVMDISDDVASVTLIKGQAGPLEGDKIIFVTTDKVGVSPQIGDALRVRY